MITKFARLEFELFTKPSKKAVDKLPGVKKAFGFFTPDNFYIQISQVEICPCPHVLNVANRFELTVIKSNLPY
jgi:hypothetical protein